MKKNLATLGLAGFLTAGSALGVNAQTTTSNTKEDISKSLSYSPENNTNEKSYVVSEKDFLTKEDFLDFQQSLEEKQNFPTDSIDMISTIDSLTNVQNVGKELVDFYGKDLLNKKMAILIKKSGGFKKLENPQIFSLISKESLIKEEFSEFLAKFRPPKDENSTRKTIGVLCMVAGLGITLITKKKK